MSGTAPKNDDLYYDIRIPKTGPDFERLTKIACTKKFKKSFELYGRNGQLQHGIDIFSNQYGICIQCKNYQGKDAKKALCDAFNGDVAAAVNYFGDKMHTYILATTAQRDTDVQDTVEAAKAKYPRLRIQVLFWEDFQDLFDEYPEIIAEFNKKLTIPTIDPAFSSHNSALHLRKIYDIFVTQRVTDLSLEEFVESLIPNDTLTYLLNNGCSITDIADRNIPTKHQKKLEADFENTQDYYNLCCFISKARCFLDSTLLTFDKLYKMGLSFLDGDVKDFFIFQSETGNPQKILAVLVLYTLFHPTVFLALRPHIVNAWKNI